MKEISLDGFVPGQVSIKIHRGEAKWFGLVGSEDETCAWENWTAHPVDPNHVDIVGNEVPLVFHRVQRTNTPTPTGPPTDIPVPSATPTSPGPPTDIPVPWNTPTP